MSTIQTNIVDYFNKIEELTNTNLKILKSINESFVSNNNNVSVSIDGTTYTIPSCFAIENKINSLQDTVENLLNIHKTGEAWYNVNGNTRAIELKSYCCAPNSIDLLNDVMEFGVDNSNPLREMLSPMPFITFNVSLPNDIFEIKVRKIIAKSNKAKAKFKINLVDKSSMSFRYAEMTELLDTLNKSEYEIYDKIYKLDTKTSNEGEGEYIVEEILNTYIDNDGYEVYELKIASDCSLTYKKSDGSVEKPLLAGCYLRNSDGTAKVEVISADNINSIIKIKLITLDALNLIPTSKSNGKINAYSSLYYFNGDSVFSRNGSYESELKIPLTEDRYVFVCLSVINSRLNVQSEWGDGLLIDTNKLTLKNNHTTFAEYYNNNVKNISDVLYDMSSSLLYPLSSISSDAYNELTSLKPIVDTSLLKVVEINTHLKASNYNESILSLDNLNSKYEESIKTISELEKLTELTYSESTTLNAAYQKRDEAIYAYNELLRVGETDSILNYKPKYRVLGCIEPKFDTTNFNIDNYALIGDNSTINIIGMQLQYFYAKPNTTPESTFIFIDENDHTKTYTHSIWNDMPAQYRNKLVYYNDGLKYEYENTQNTNETTFNQVSIPISVNESVSIRVRFIYDLGQPFNTITSKWSDKLDIPFDNNLIPNGDVYDIINRANDNMLSITANNIIKTSGIEAHLHPNLDTIQILHSAKNIDSGFVTNEQNTITLDTKLKEMSSIIETLYDQMNGSENNLEVSVSTSTTNTVLIENEYNNIILKPYNIFLPATEIPIGPNIPTVSPFNSTESNDSNDLTIDSTVSIPNININGNNDEMYIYKDGIVSTIINVKLRNNGKSNIRLYSIFPGNKEVNINDTTTTFMDKYDYCSGTNGGVWMKYFDDNNDEKLKLQSQNQFLTFRINDAWTGNAYYEENAHVSSNKQDLLKITETDEFALNTNSIGMNVYPQLTNKFSLCLNADDTRFMLLKPNEEIVIPMVCEYIVAPTNGSILKNISFDIRTSLYGEPHNYAFSVKAYNNIPLQHSLSNTNRKNYFNTLTNSVVNLFNKFQIK